MEISGNDYLNTKVMPVGLASVRAGAVEAWAYHKMCPYPTHGFRSWKTEENGPLPTPMLIPKYIVMRGARWLFGKPPVIHCHGNEALEVQMRKWWAQNELDSKLVSFAWRGALEGGYALKFAYNPNNKKRPVVIQRLSIATEVQFFYHPHDRTDLLMARVQYLFADAKGEKFYYREEWTKDKFVLYKPLKVSDLGQGNSADESDLWIAEKEEENRFGLIPIHHVKNIESDDTYGLRDLEDCYGVINRINLTRHIMDRDNQMSSNINPILLDAEEADTSPPAPGEARHVKSDTDNQGNPVDGKVIIPEVRGTLREPMSNYANDLIGEVFDAAGQVKINQDEITNVGNMTRAVLEQIYAPQIEMTNEKRKSQGTNGIAAFFALMALGLQNASVNGLGVSEDNDETYQCDLVWKPYFELGEEEKTSIVNRTIEEEAAGYITNERAVERIAAMNDIEDAKKLAEELEKEPAPTPTENDDTLVEPTKKSGAAE
jgi:hypothetical protein